ncbi:ABC transporter substrate-binding protein [Moorena producens]|uniref:ABC transporter substrate-binding protein n=1 Tax=Moorena producens TaxID=1155739 RepID=UPI003C791F29
MNSAVPRNPYIIGRPIDENDPELFWGRQSLFRFIEDKLRKKTKVIILYGQRRIGKSSLLRNIPTSVDLDNFAFVPFDLQSYIHKSLGEVLEELAIEILDSLELDSPEILLPDPTALNTDPSLFSNQFLPQVYQTLGNQNLALLLDELETLNTPDNNLISQHLFPYLKSLVAQQDNLYLILCVGQESKDLPDLLGIFKDAPTTEIGLLDQQTTQELITKPAVGLLTYETAAIEAIYNLSAGHPYFTQVLCFAIFSRARELQQWHITPEDVENSVDQALENASAGLAWIRDGLSIPERVVFSAVAEADNAVKNSYKNTSNQPLSLLKDYGVIQTNSLREAPKQLAKRGFLDKNKRKITIEFIRRWLIKRYPLQQEILELEKLAQDQINPIYQQATTEYQQGKISKALGLYEQVVELNPNHFSAIFALAEGYLELGEFEKAVTYYQRAYKVDQIRNQDGLVRSLINYGNDLIEQQEYTTAREQFQQVLEIAPDNLSAKEKLLDIDNYLNSLEKEDRSSSNLDNLIPRNSLLSLLTIAAGVAIISLVGVVFYNVSNPCPTGAQKVFGIRCVVNTSKSISRGEHSLFPRIDNKDNIDPAAEAFRNQNYGAAAQVFYQAWQANQNDPELLIYYNNSRARQQGFEPFTIAVVVPIDQSKDRAQEILRGVAQAQHQFNNSGGLNGRFMEIAIANDGNDRDQAKEIAKALVKDNSILGVIGHNSSDASNAALPIYDQAGLAMISATSASSGLTSLDVKNNVFFRTVASNLALGVKLAKHVKSQAGLDKVVIFYDDDSVYSKSFKQDFQKYFEQLGGEVVREIKLNDSKLNITEEVNKSLYQDQVKAAMLFPRVESVNTAINFAKANANLNPNPNNRDQQGLRLFGASTLYVDKTLKQGNQGVEGLTIVVPWFRESAQAKNFSTAARELWKGDVNWRTATSFDATQAFIQALFKDADRKLVLDRLRNIKLSPSDTSGLPLQFTDQGERESEPVLVEVVDGEFKLLK